MGLFRKQKKKKKEKVGNQMVVMNYGKQEEKKVKDSKSQDIFGLLLFDQHSIRQITVKSGMTKASEEYQVHYHSLVYQIQSGSQMLNISIPLCYFNYKQQVSGGSVKFTLVEVNEISDASKPIAEAKAAELMQTGLHTHIMSLFPDAEPVIAPLQQIHRHPGRMNCFSGTDYDKDITNPGICFPFLNAPDNTPSFGSIIAHQPMGTELIHTEYRQVSGNVEAEGGIKYLHGKSVTYIKGHLLEKPSGFDSWLQTFDNKVESYMLGDRVNEKRLSDGVKELLETFDSINFEPSLDLVFAENVTRAVSYRHGYNKSKPATTTIHKYGKDSQSKTLLQMMQEDMDEERKEKKSDSQMIREAIDKDIALKGTKPVSDEEGCYPMDRTEMDALEELDYANVLRTELQACGVDKTALESASADQIFDWAEALNLVMDVTLADEPVDTFSEVKDGTWNNKGA